MIALLQGVFGGIFIGVAMLANLRCSGGIAGAAIFSVGLLSILQLSLKLYTGMIGYINKCNYKEIFVVLCGNLLGCICLIPFRNIEYSQVLINKLNSSELMVFLNSIICGLLVYVAVEGWKQGNPLVTILSVVGFIMAGGEHCIADAALIALSRLPLTLPMIRFIIITIIGNSIGAIILKEISTYDKKNNRNFSNSNDIYRNE